MMQQKPGGSHGAIYEPMFRPFYRMANSSDQFYRQVGCPKTPHQRRVDQPADRSCLDPEQQTIHLTQHDAYTDVEKVSKMAVAKSTVAPYSRHCLSF